MEELSLSPLLLVHPVIQAGILILSCWVTGQGLIRFVLRVQGKRAAFNWKRHTRLGLLVLCLWLTGSLVGTAVMTIVYGTPYVFGTHLKTALLMIPLLLFGLLTGLRMHLKKRKRSLLPAIHGLNNLLVSGLAVVQARSGWDLLMALALQ